MHLIALVNNEDPTPIFSTPETKVSNKIKASAMATLSQPSSAPLKAVVRNGTSDTVPGAEVAKPLCVRLFVEIECMSEVRGQPLFTTEKDFGGKNFDYRFRGAGVEAENRERTMLEKERKRLDLDST